MSKAKNPKPLLGFQDTYQLEPFQYPWAWDMTDECIKNTWTPEEVATATDVALWKGNELTSAERHLFLSVMSQLTTFDIQRGDDAAETFLSIFQPAEISHFFKRLVWEEAMHTQSYRYIIETMGLNLEIYKRWETVPALRARIDFANEVSQNIFKNRNPQSILFALIFWSHIFEGIWFVMSLAGPIQSMARRNLFKGAAEQFQYILRDEFQHIRFGIKLTNEFIAQHPETMNPDSIEVIKGMFRHSMLLEEDYIRYCLPKPILGYNARDHMRVTRWYANMRLGELGLDPIFPEDEAVHVMPWMNEMTMIRKEKNFFETRVNEYQSGGALDWGDED